MWGNEVYGLDVAASPPVAYKYWMDNFGQMREHTYQETVNVLKPEENAATNVNVVSVEL